MGKKYERYFESDTEDWVYPAQTGYKMACCDCGLVHKMDFEIHEGQVIFRVERDNRSTAAIRRHRSKLPVGVPQGGGS